MQYNLLNNKIDDLKKDSATAFNLLQGKFESFMLRFEKKMDEISSDTNGHIREMIDMKSDITRNKDEIGDLKGRVKSLEKAENSGKVKKITILWTILGLIGFSIVTSLVTNIIKAFF